MKRNQYRVTCAAILACGALVAGACTSTGDTAEVSAESGDYGASLATSTTIAGAPGASARSTDPADARAAAAERALRKLAANPELLEDLDNLTPEQLEELTGLSSEELGTLGITLRQSEHSARYWTRCAPTHRSSPRRTHSYRCSPLEVERFSPRPAS
ncbi:MAG: hypothetical protein M5U19_00035 [Microthrixaceae bacterium]|nr:hypothetical protein [Microthrixaceae bacterium]